MDYDPGVLDSRINMRVPITLLVLVTVAQAQQFRQFPKQTIPARGVWSIAIGDVDGDGDNDVVLGKALARNVLLLNDGTGRFTDVSSTHMPNDTETPFGLALVDVDGDRDLDLVCANNNWKTGQNRLYLNDGTGKFTDATTGRLPVSTAYTYCVSVADVDRDGDIDIVFGNASNGSAGQDRLLLNDGKGRFTDVTSTRFRNPSTYTYGIALGDIDGDGDVDIVPGTYHYNDVWLNDGRGNFSASAGPMTKFTGLRPTLGDVDGDGDLDLVVARTGSNSLFFNDGKGKFTRATTGWPTYSLSSQAAVLADLDDDGDLDAVFPNFRTPLGNHQYAYQNEVYLNDGRGRFVDATAVRLPSDVDNSMTVGVGDIDQDGDADILFGNLANPTRLYVNLHRQVVMPDAAQLSRRFRLEFVASPGYATASQAVLPLLNFAPLTPRLRIAPFGQLGLALSGLWIGPPIVLPAPTGWVSVPVTIPNDPQLVGKIIYLQGLVAHNARVARLTNVAAEKISR